MQNYAHRCLLLNNQGGKRNINEMKSLLVIFFLNKQQYNILKTLALLQVLLVTLVSVSQLFPLDEINCQYQTPLKVVFGATAKQS